MTLGPRVAGRSIAGLVTPPPDRPPRPPGRRLGGPARQLAVCQTRPGDGLQGSGSDPGG